MRFKGSGIVWDKETDRQLCRFDKDGHFESTDETVNQKLLALGYVSDAPDYIDVDFEEVPEVPEEPKEPKPKPKTRSHKKKEAVI